MIDSSAFLRLQGIGLAPSIVAQLGRLAPLPADGPAPALLRITEVQRETLTLHDGQAQHSGRLQPALRHALEAEADAIAVGDWVLATRNEFGEWWAQQRLPPLNQLARRLHDGRDKLTRVVIASNIDTALLVMGLDLDFNLRRLERYVALVRMAGVPAVVVLTKRDLSAHAESRLRETQAALPADVPALAVDARGGEPHALLSRWLAPGQTLVLLGSSGAGKSTLTNALTGALTGALTDARTGALTGSHAQATGANRDGDSRGRHTTTARSLHTTREGACIIDTPGLRTLRLDGEAGALESAFDDIARLAPLCRFRDCRHEAEPGCAVREGVSAERLRNYKKLDREARRDTQTAMERKAVVQSYEVRSRAVRAHMTAKRG